MSNLLLMDESNGNGGYITTNTTAGTTNASVSRARNNTCTKNINSTSKNNSNNNININSSNNKNNNYNNNNNNNINDLKSNSISKSNNCNTSTNNISNIMAAASNAATSAASAAGTCVVGVQLPNSVSNEDLSQSLSEYTDADESISAPTEFLAEFLSAVMLKDYKKALKYCKLILQYEPNNATAKEFYPLILDKLRVANTSSDSDENYNKSSSSPELILEAASWDPSAGESDEHDEHYLRHHRNIAYGGMAERKGYAITVMTTDSNDPNSNVSSSSSNEVDVEEGDEVDGDDGDDEEGCQFIDNSLSDEDAEDEDGDVDDEDDCNEDDDDDDDEDDDEDDIMSSSGDDLPVDEQQILIDDVLDLDVSSANACDVDAGINISNSSRNSSSGGKGSSRSDNTTHSYSSLLLEEEDDIVAANLHFPKDLHTTDLDVSNGNKVPSTSCSDSESPTEPLTQRLAAILRSKCGVSNTGG